MILANGKISKSKESKAVLKNMRSQIIRTLDKPVLDPLLVIEACDKLAEKIAYGEYDHIIEELKKEGITSSEQISFIILLLSKKHLLYKIGIELDKTYPKDVKWQPLNSGGKRHRKFYPLGVLFHIAAGNIDGLPAYSLVEGLLAGNINILKLPQADKGLSILLLSELIKIEPRLSDYIYVFDTPSYDIKTMEEMASMADGIVVWGGDQAVKAVRKGVGPNKKIIEWGHKISFAYITEQGMKEEVLEELAYHIFDSKQLLCSSCQGIFVETNDMDMVYDFSERFIKIMEKTAEKFPQTDIGIKGQINLHLYNEELEMATRKQGKQKIYKGKECSIIALEEGPLQTSLMFGNCWVMPLERKNIVEKLYKQRGYLQTVGLLCAKEEKEELADIFGRAGAVRITTGKDMSTMLLGEAHDGEYPLRQYSRIIEY